MNRPPVTPSARSAFPQTRSGRDQQSSFELESYTRVRQEVVGRGGRVRQCVEQGHQRGLIDIGHAGPRRCQPRGHEIAPAVDDRCFGIETGGGGGAKMEFVAVGDQGQRLALMDAPSEGDQAHGSAR
jgi:hypothetical protein